MLKIFKQKPFPFSMLILVILVLLHVFGSRYSLYWTYPGFDILVHVFAGLWISLLVLWLVSIFGQINSLKEYKIRTFLTALFTAVLFGIIWEVVENISKITFVTADLYSQNTALDITSDAFGGILAYLYFIRKKRQNCDKEEVLHSFYNKTGIIKN